jgi:hypothetical protein
MLLLLHYDGSAWSVAGPFGVDTASGLWGSSASDIFGVGYEIVHYNGSIWSDMAGEPTGAYLNDISGTSASNVFTVGDAGLILRYDGSSWSEMASGTTATLAGVWVGAPSDVFVVGGGDDQNGQPLPGFILHYDGSAWSPMPVAATALWGIWGSSGADVFAVGDSGTILHYGF